VTAEPNPACSKWVHHLFPLGRLRHLGALVERTEPEAEQELLHELRQAQNEVFHRLASGAAHDLTNLLLGIRGYCELALTELDRNADVRTEIHGIMLAADRAKALIRQLHAFGCDQVQRPEILNLTQVVLEMESLLRRMIKEDIELEMVVDRVDVYVHADQSQLERVLANLAVNACNAMSAGGRLTFEVGVATFRVTDAPDLGPRRFARLTVSDMGCGMTAKTVARIFEPLFTTKSNGRGLGLANVHSIITESGGSISVDSEFGVGTTFRIYLPLARPVRAAAASLPAATTGDSGVPRYTQLHDCAVAGSDP
jgi:two-component system cell cycle sensor histidine kinase/response regulator CckA